MSSTARTLALNWIAANTLGWAIAIAIPTTPPFQNIWGWIACGAIVGTAQWLPLHGRLHFSPTWIAGTCLAWVLGLWAGVAHGFLAPDPYWAGAVGGSLAGVVQSWILWRRVSRPALWVPASIVSSTFGWVAGAWVGFSVYHSLTETTAYLAAGAAGGAVIGMISAPVLLSMLRHPKQRQEPA
ncbi:MAG: hypothetical protein LAQ69_39970 [Acidobacteriia bacterium]|nr:hypothetical protein [Terriglobia bacterium]